MKKRFTLLLMCCAASVAGHSQSSITGIYRSPDDFSHQRLSFPAARHPRLVIRANTAFYLPYITVIDGRHKTRYLKDSVFGYRTADNTVYRFYAGGAYELLNPGERPLLYRSAVMPGGRGARPVYSYYFSEDATASLAPLTRSRVADALGRDSTFVEQLYERFRDDDELLQYDSLHQTYRLSRLYAQLHRR